MNIISEFFCDLHDEWKESGDLAVIKQYLPVLIFAVVAFVSVFLVAKHQFYEQDRLDVINTLSNPLTAYEFIDQRDDIMERYNLTEDDLRTGGGLIKAGE